MVTVGIFLLKKVTAQNVLFANLLGTLAFFLVSNFFVWTEGKLYTQDMNGLALILYANAIPYVKNTLMSNLLFSALMFGAFEAAKRQVRSLAY